MKKLLLFGFAVLLFASCAKPIVAVKSATALDYAKYQKEGVFLTESNSVSFTYEAIASVSALNLSGVLDVEKAKKDTKKQYYNDDFVDLKSTGNWFSPTRETVLNELCRKAKELGANGIIKLEFRYIYYPAITSAGSQYGYEASGMAIKK